MNWIFINIPNLIKQYLGNLFQNETDWFKVLLQPLIDLFIDYDSYRRDQLFEINTTGQVIALQGLLNKKFDPIQRRIDIIDGSFYYALLLPLNTSYGDGVPIPLDSGEGSGEAISLNIHERSGLHDFIIVIPAGISTYTNEIKGQVDDRKMAGKKYDINIV